MAIPLPFAELICSEHAFRPLPQRVLLLGRQTMTFNSEQLAALASKFDLAVPEYIRRDDYTTHAINNPQRECVSDETFFEMLGAEIDAIDHSNFEGANIIHDLCEEIPESLKGKFDFIVNGSVLDNVWDTARAMRNIDLLLSENGRLVSIETATSSPFSYSALSPSWYFDHFVTNAWVDCRIYVAAVDGWDQLIRGPWPVIGFDLNAQERPNAFSPSIGDKLGICAFVAERGIQSTRDLTPIQSHYRSDGDWKRFLRLAEPFQKSARSFYMGKGGLGDPIAGHGGAWVSCGYWGE